MNIHISRRVDFDPVKNESNTHIQIVTSFLNIKDKAALELALEDTLAAIKASTEDSGKIKINISTERYHKKKDEIVARKEKKTTPKLSPETGKRA